MDSLLCQFMGVSLNLLVGYKNGLDKQRADLEQTASEKQSDQGLPCLLF